MNRIRLSWVVAGIAVVVVAWGVLSASPFGFVGLFLLIIFGVPLLLGRGLSSALRVRHRGARFAIYLVLVLAAICVGVWLLWLFKPQM
ncbi:MAG TPA: hypothetical protein VK733_14235 [Gemmatimonadaceae bacterium]|nr:hypothetical protein [Gemmatimonadaceae bacterium]